MHKSKENSISNVTFELNTKKYKKTYMDNMFEKNKLMNCAFLSGKKPRKNIFVKGNHRRNKFRISTFNIDSQFCSPHNEKSLKFNESKGFSDGTDSKGLITI